MKRGCPIKYVHRFKSVFLPCVQLSNNQLVLVLLHLKSLFLNKGDSLRSIRVQPSPSGTSVFQFHHQALQFARDQLVVAEQECSDARGVPGDAGQGRGHCWALLAQTQNTRERSEGYDRLKSSSRQKERGRLSLPMFPSGAT